MRQRGWRGERCRWHRCSGGLGGVRVLARRVGAGKGLRLCEDCLLSAMPRLSPSLLLAASFAAALCQGRAEGATPTEGGEFFEKKIRPVLVTECCECHNAKKAKGGLRLDWRGGWQAGGDSGAVLVPGDAAGSLLIQAIRHEDPDLKMPAKAPKLDEAVIADFVQWVKMGAPDPRDAPPVEVAGKPNWADLLAARKGWWSLRPVQKTVPPAVRDARWSEHPVDRFLLAQMEAHGLAPARDADPRTLLRRLTFALTGLPPTPEEAEAFSREPNVAAAVDRLLASPRFGEHWARHWMDLVRYADTHGSEGDPEIPEAWRYRDYLIRAFNADVPLDQLIREHLAGDLLREPRWNREEEINESMIGPAHLRLVEHGFQPVDTLDEQVKIVDSQIDVAMKAFQGLTVTCARCHDHKFDAISQRDYTALAGVFMSSRPAMVTIDTPERLAKNRTELLALKPRIKAALAEAWQAEAARFPERLLGERGQATETARRQKEIGELALRIGETESAVRRRILAARGVAVVENLPHPRARWSFDGDARDALGALHGHLEGGAEIRGGRLVLNGKGAFMRTDLLPRELRAKTLEAWVSPANLEQRGGGVITVQSPRGTAFDSIVFAENDSGRWVAGSEGFRRSRPLGAPKENARPGEFVHVAAVYQKEGGIALFRNGEAYGARYEQGGPSVTYAAQDAHLLFGLRHTGAGNGFFAGEIEEARLYDRALTPEEIAASFRAGASQIGVSSEELAKACTAAERATLGSLLTDLTKRREELKRAESASASGWSAALADAAKDQGSPLHAWAKLRDRGGAEFTRGWSELSAKNAGAVTPAVWDVAREGYAQCFHYGPGLGGKPEACGEFSIAPEGERVLTGLLPAGALTHTLSRKHGGVLATPRFKIESDFISVRAFGGGGAWMRLIVDGYPLGRDGIFPRAALDKDQPAWITIDVKYRRGAMAYLEFATANDLTRSEKSTEDGRSWFGVERIVFHDAAGKPAEPAAAWLAGDAPRSAEELAARCAQRVQAAIAAWRDDALTEEQRAGLDWFVRRGLLPVALPLLEKVRPLVAEYRRLEAEIPVPRHAPGVVEADGYDAPLLPRGDHLKPGEPVPRAFVAVFGGEPFQAGAASGRRQLAEAIANPGNPLTARVMVNRVWHWLFGRGLVGTPDNFGRMGERPTHPELLDFLAAHCVEHGWSAKELIRFLVTTRAFRLSSEASPAVRESDPGDQWLSHFRVRRLEAESIRDALLAVSGRLDTTMFGPGVDARATADQQARRSVYFTIRRTNLSPFLDVFDAPKPFSTLGRREATNVPAQSLTLLNDPLVIELARRWSRAEIGRKAPDAETRIRAMFTRALARPPGDDELRASAAFLDSLAKERQLAPEKRLADERLWQDFAQSLFNLKEFIYLR